MVVNTNQTQVAAYDAKTRFSELLDRVEAGEEVTITKHGRPVARMLPVQPARDPELIRKAFEELNQIAQRNTLGGLKIKDLINEGRR